jgi:predicted transposase YdaD
MDTEKPSGIIPENLKLKHDDYFRETFQVRRIARAVLKKVLPTATLPHLDLEELTVEERQKSDDVFKALTADVIYKVPVKETQEHVNFFVLMEHKSFQDYQTIFQLWGYIYRICFQEWFAAMERGESRTKYRLPPIVAIIVYHGETQFKGATELAEMFQSLPGLAPYLPRLQAILFDLSSIDDDDPILNDPEVPELRVVLMVLKTVFRKDVVMKVTDVLRALKPHSDDPATRRIILATWIYLVNNAEHLRRNLDAMLGTFKEIIGDGDMPTMVEIWKAEGKAIGRAEEKVETARNMVLAALQKKFKNVPQEIEAAVLAMSDPIALKSVLEHVIDSNTLEEFETIL